MTSPRRALRTTLALAAPGLLLLAACGGSGDAESEAEEASSALSATDGTGTEITLEAPAERIACLDAVCLDVLKELDLQPTASTQAEMYSDASFWGEGNDITAIGGSFFEPDLEGILAAEPDLVIGAASVHAELRDALGSTPLYLADLGAVDAESNLETIAGLLDREDEAGAALERYEATLAAYGGDREVPLLSMYGGATDDIGIDAADSAIGRTIGGATAYPWPDASEGDGGFLEINLEQILDVDPAWIWVLDFGFDPEAPALVDQLAEEPVWGSLRAVEDGHVEVAPPWWGGTNGTLTQQLVLDTVMPTVYPEEFPEPLGPLAQDQ